MASAAPPSIDDIRRVEISKADAPIVSVTVYSDRAEINRAIKFDAEPGTQDIILDGLPDSVQENSIRVSGGRGNATILEVSYKNVFRTSPTAVNNTNAAELHDTYKDYQNRLEAVRHELEALKKEEEVLENFVGNVQSLGQPKAGNDGEQLLSDKTATTFVELVKFYRDALNSIDERREKLNELQKELRKKAELVDKEIKQKNAPADQSTTRQIVISLLVPEASSLELWVAYMVSNAGWVPSYDVRVNSEHANSIELTYFGSVHQSTNEDWKDVKLALSTARPSIVGTPPVLPTAIVTLEDARHRRPSTFFDEAASGGGGEGASSVCYYIPRPASIESDNRPHKVPIATINLAATLSYVCVPKKSQHGYLQAVAVNTDENYVLLPGQANIFFDNSYVSTSRLKAVNYKEKFDLSLGVDPAIKVEYKPVGKFQETSGIFSKTQVITYRHHTTIKNTKTIPITIKVIDQLPFSQDEKIKVRLIDPVDVTAQTENPKLNDQHNIEWELSIAAGGTHELNYVYSVEWPKGQDIEADPSDFSW